MGDFNQRTHRHAGAAGLLGIKAAARAPPAAAEPVAEAPPPQPAEPERPRHTLVGTVVGAPQNVAVIRDQTSKNLVRLHLGEAVSGWFLRSVDSRTTTNSQTVTMALPAPNSTPASLPAVSEAPGTSREF